MGKPIPLAEAAKAWGLKKNTLYHAYRQGELRCGKIGVALFTDEEALKEWWNRCQEKACRPASTCANAPAEVLSGLSRTQDAKLAPVAAKVIAQELKRPSTNTLDSGFGPRTLQGNRMK